MTDDRAFVDGPILAGSFYPVQAWIASNAAMRAEALARRGHDDLQFSMRNMREAGSKIVKGISKFLLDRVYSEGHCELVTQDNFLASAIFILEMNGAKNIDGRISRDEAESGKLVFEVSVTYR